MKNRIVFFVIIALSLILLSGCGIITEFINGHECTYTLWYVKEKATCLSEGIEERCCFICLESEQRSIEMLPHIPELVGETAPTCTVDGHKEGTRCAVCKTPIYGVEPIPATGHTEVIDPAVEPTKDKLGKTEGKHCTVCGEITVPQMSIFSGDYNNYNLYDGNYAYKSLLKLENGKSMQDYYNYLDTFADSFHESDDNAKTKEISEKSIYYAAEVPYSDFGINTDEAITVWSAYRIDHPLYYWIDGNLSYTDSYLTLRVYDEYANGEVRELINNRLYTIMYEFIAALEGETEEYLICLAFHDMIINNASYVYEADGVTPSKAPFAHNVTGVLLEGAGVCESYTKAYQMLLNYCKIDNIFVSGYAQEDHSWNLICLDGQWYWCDLTWDDVPEWSLGIRHSYFCVNDKTVVNRQDGAKQEDPKSFLDDHTPYTKVGLDVNYSYELPSRARNSYSYSGELIRDNTIILGGLHYVINGYNTVCLTKIEAEGNVVIPEEIKYNNKTYTVVAIGLFEDGLFKTGNILKYNTVTFASKITSISIPKTVRFIWDYAFDYSSTIKEFIVDPENECFTSNEGILFTKTLYTLIKFPMAKNISSYTIPEQTREIAFSSFGDGGNVFYPKHLKKLVIGDNVTAIGSGNFGKGYRDSEPLNESDVIIPADYMERLNKILTVIVE